MNIEQLRELIERLTADATQVTNEELALARAFIREQRTHLAGQDPSEDVITALTELRDARAAITTVTDVRAGEAAQLEEQRQGLLNDLDDPAEPESPAVTEEEDPVEPVGAPAPDPTPEQQPVVDPGQTPAAPATDSSQVESDLAVAASAQRPARKAPIGTFRTGVNPRPAPADTRPVITASVTAAGGARGFVQGQRINSTAELATAMTNQLQAMSSGRGGTGEKVYVANVVHTYPEDRTLREKDWAGNFTKIEAATGEQALVAAGGLCAPPTTLYDVQVLGSVARPIRDALTRFQVDRGAIQFRPNSSAATALTTGTGTGVDTWTNSQDAAQGTTGDLKGCYVVDCPPIQTAEVQAIYLCLEFSNITARFDPETTAANIKQGMIVHARVAENELLRKMQTTSKVLSGAKTVGASRDILVYLDRAVAYYRNRHRLDSSLSLDFLLPAWVLYMMRSDLARQIASGDWMSALALSNSMIMQWFGERGVNPIFHLDGGIGGVNEVQTITITGAPTGGSFTLTFQGQTTGPIPYNAAIADVTNALNALSNVNAGQITVAGGPQPASAITVAFGGQYEHIAVPVMTASGGNLTGGTTPAVTVAITTASSLTSVVNGVSIASQVYGNAAAGSVIPTYPAQIDTLLYATGSKLFLDGGNLDLGLVRDSVLNSRNRYRQFSETFEGFADRGIENLRLILSVVPNGGTAGTIDPNTITA